MQAAHCVNPIRRHNSFRGIRLRWNFVARLLCCGALQVAVPDPLGAVCHLAC